MIPTALEVGTGDETQFVEWDDLPTLKEVKTAYCELVIRACDGNKKEAAKALRINRTTLYRNLEG